MEQTPEPISRARAERGRRVRTDPPALDDRGIPLSPDPDSRARTHLANERTFLAWFRTGLTLVALGVAAAHFLTATTPSDDLVVRWFSTLVIGIGVLLVAVGLWRYLRARIRIDKQEFETGHMSILVTSMVALAAGVLAILLVWLLRSG